MRELLYGAAYYDEYMPYERLEKDVAMMKKAGINTVRIAESTWSTCEPQEGVFDFSHVIRVMDAMEEAEINVIIGTPTYAVPTWMVKAIRVCWRRRSKAEESMVRDRSWTSHIRLSVLCGKSHS